MCGINYPAYYNSLLLPHTPVISVKKIKFLFYIINIIEFFFYCLYAKSSVILWFKALIRTEFFSQIKHKYKGQFGKILGIKPS